jgi:hypothetical protein
MSLINEVCPHTFSIFFYFWPGDVYNLTILHEKQYCITVDILREVSHHMKYTR